MSTVAVQATFSHMLFLGITRVEPNDQIILANAGSICISEDLKTYTIKLGRLFWSDGSPLTAFDYENSWKEILNPNFSSPFAHLSLILDFFSL